MDLAVFFLKLYMLCSNIICVTILGPLENLGDLLLPGSVQI